MKRWATLSLLLILALAGSEASAQVKNIDDRVQEVQAVVGSGADVTEAKKAARAAAVDQVVETFIARSDEERRKYLAVRDSILTDLPRFIEDLNMTDKYHEGDRVVVEVSGRVLKRALRERLEHLGVVKSLDQTFTAMTLPQVAVVVAPQTPVFAAQLLQQHLTRRQLAVVDQEALDNLAALDASSIGVAAQAAGAASTSDVVLWVTAKVNPTDRLGDMQMYQAEVNIQAYISGLPVPFAEEAYKSREIAFATTADRDKSQRACMEEAIGGAVEPLMQRVVDEMQSELKRGRTITLNLAGEAASLELAEAVLRPRCAEASFSKTPEGLRLVARYHGPLTDLLEKLSTEQELGVEVRDENSRSANLFVKRR